MQNVDPVPHQIEAVYEYALKRQPIRYMLAHDAGAGKTVMAGLVIKELKARGAIHRYCIVVPGKLTYQWMRELQDKFGEHLSVINKATIDETYGRNPWDTEDSIITSMDFAKREENRRLFGLSSKFDLIIVDEAHRMSATKQGFRVRKTERYFLGEVLSAHTRHLLFLTATPHRGDPANFKLLMDLLVPGLAGNDMMNNQLDGPLFLRRSKEQMIDMDGKKLFKERRVRTRDLELDGAEKRVYDSITEYVQNAYVKAEKKANRNALTFAMIQLQKRAASSMMAILTTLEKRRVKLGNRLAGSTLEDQNFETDEEQYADMTDEEREREFRKMEGVDVTSNRHELVTEIGDIGVLIDSIKSLMEAQEEAKLIDLKLLLAEINKDEPSGKLLVFTESKVTMKYLTGKLQSIGHMVVNIHGGMKLEDRVRKEREFKYTADIMVATEAASEGINLQFCHYMVNYDLPWNPNVLEQRMGRIHRYGQSEIAHVWNIVATNTREGAVINKLLDKVREIRETMGKDVFDVIGQVVPGKTLDCLFRDVVAGRAAGNEIASRIDEAADQYIGFLEAYKEAGLLPLNLESVKETIERAEMMGLGPTNLQRMFEIAVREDDGIVTENSGTLVVNSSSNMIRAGLEKRYKGITFNKDMARSDSSLTLMLFGEPLFNYIMKWIGEECEGELERGAVFESSDMDGYVVFHECNVVDGKWNEIDRRLLAHYVDRDGNVEQVPPYVLGLLKPLETRDASNVSCIKSVDGMINQSIEAYLPEIKASVNRNVNIKEKSLRFLKKDINDMDKAQEEAEGNDVDRIAAEKDEKMKQLQKFQNGLPLERMIAPQEPKLLTVARVIPSKDESGKQQVDNRSDIERAGMKYVMQHEKRKGRVPRDVSKENYGWDIESSAPSGGKRLIECKGLSGEGLVYVSWNEWLKAKMHGSSYYLYVVSNVTTDPILTIVRNPASKIDADEKITFSIPFNEIREAS